MKAQSVLYKYKCPPPPIVQVGRTPCQSKKLLVVPELVRVQLEYFFLNK